MAWLLNRKLQTMSLTLLCFISFSLPALACLGYLSEDTLFFTEIPVKISKADFIAKITITDIKQTGLEATVTARVSDNQKGTIKGGQIVQFQYLVSSCGPNHKVQEQGLIVAKSLGEKDGKLILQPYMHKRSDNNQFRLVTLPPPAP